MQRAEKEGLRALERELRYRMSRLHSLKGGRMSRPMWRRALPRSGCSPGGAAIRSSRTSACWRQVRRRRIISICF